MGTVKIVYEGMSFLETCGLGTCGKEEEVGGGGDYILGSAATAAAGKLCEQV